MSVVVALLQPLTFEDGCCCLFQSAYNPLSHLSFMRTPCIVFYFQEHELMPPEEDNTLVGYKSLVHPDSCLVPLTTSLAQPSLPYHDALRFSALWARIKGPPFVCFFSVILSQRWEKWLRHLSTFSATLHQEIWYSWLLTGEGNIGRWKQWMKE